MDTVCVQLSSVSLTFYHSMQDYKLVCHGDGFLVKSNAKELDALVTVLDKNFECRALPWVGPGWSGWEAVMGKLLKCMVDCEEMGFTWALNDGFLNDIFEAQGNRLCENRRTCSLHMFKVHVMSTFFLFLKCRR